MRHLLILMVALCVGLSGCAMTGGDDDGGTGATARDVDTVQLRNGDILVGELTLEKDAVQIATDYLDRISLERRHLESLKVLANGSVKLQTRHGDVLHGSLGKETLELRTKTGQDVALKLQTIQKITFAE